MKIGIVGSGEMGGKIGKLWARAGHQILFSSRHPERLKELVREAGENARGGTVDNAVSFGDVVLLAVNFTSLENAVKSARGFEDKIVIDITNPVSWDEDSNQLIQLLPAGATSASRLRELAPKARIVKAFSHLPSQFLAQALARPPGLAVPQDVTVFFCGDDAEGKRVASRLIEDAGFTPFDLGPLSQARHMEIPGTLAFKAVPPEQAQRLVSALPQAKRAA